jgi:hypothetical protein
VSLTDFLAWWGAVISTGVLVWDVVKWRLAGPRLRLTVTSGMESINIPEYEGKMLMNAQVVNRGDRSTTITNLGFLYYKNVWNRLRNRPDRSFIIGTPNTRQPLQYGTQTWRAIEDGEPVGNPAAKFGKSNRGKQKTVINPYTKEEVSLFLQKTVQLAPEKYPLIFARFGLDCVAAT